MAKRRAKERTALYSKEIHNQNTVLGLDCSSKTIGWGIIAIKDSGLILLAHGHFKPLTSAYPEMVRLNDTYEKIGALCERFNPDHIAVEDIFLFMKGKSQARTITILTAFNRIASLAAFRIAKNINFYSVHQIRKIIKEHYRLGKTIQKEEMPDVIRKHLSTRFSNVLNIKDEPADETYDEADGIAASWAGALHVVYPDFVNPLIEPKPKKKRKSKK